MTLLTRNKLLGRGRPTAILCVVILCCSSSVNAQGVLAHSFESDLEGFGPNGLGVTISRDTFGATEGMHSLKIDLVTQAFYAGALTEMPHPDFNDPPGMDSMSFDLTITQPFPTGETDFVDIFLVVFGSTQPGPTQQEGLEISFQEDRVAIGDLPVGTHKIEFELDLGLHPTQFNFVPFNDIFGSGPNDIIPTGYQIIVNKRNSAPWTGWVDNIRFLQETASQPGDFDNDGDVDGRDFLVWQRGNSPSSLSATDLAAWQANYGFSPLVAFAAIPEPTSGLLLLASAIGTIATSRRFRRHR